MAHSASHSALIVPELSAFWRAGCGDPKWTVDGIAAIARWFGTESTIIFAGSPDHTAIEFTTEASGFQRVWTEWIYKQAPDNNLPQVAVICNGRNSTLYQTFGPRVAKPRSDIVLYVADKSDFELCQGNLRNISNLWRKLLDGPFDVSQWNARAQLMGNLVNGSVQSPGIAHDIPMVTVLYEVQGRLLPTQITIPSAA